MYTDLLTKIRNAKKAKKPSLKVPFSQADKAVAEIMEKAGFLKKVEVKGRSFKKVMEIELNPDRDIQGLKFISKPSRRLYAGYKDIKKVKGGQGFVVISTSKGIINGEEARKLKIGGQLLFEIW